MADNSGYEPADEGQVAPPSDKAQTISQSEVVVKDEGQVDMICTDGKVSPENLGEDEDVEKEKQKLRDRDPVFFCSWITSRPKLCFGKIRNTYLRCSIDNDMLIVNCNTICILN